MHGIAKSKLRVDEVYFIDSKRFAVMPTGDGDIVVGRVSGGAGRGGHRWECCTVL